MAWVVLGCAGLCKLARAPLVAPSIALGAGAGTLVIACGLMALCSAQCRVWESSEHLWGQALAHASWSSELHHFVGTSLADLGKFDRAYAELREALRLRPHYFEATYDLGVLLTAAVRPTRPSRTCAKPGGCGRRMRWFTSASAGPWCTRGMSTRRSRFIARRSSFKPNFPNLHFNLGIAFLHQRKVDQAINELTKAVELRPWYTEAYDILGGALVLHGRLDEAVVQYQQALRLDPDNSASRIDLGLTLARQGHSAQAISELREAIRRNRQNPEAHHVLGAILVNLGRIREATAEFEEVLRLRPDDAQARDFLAMAKGKRM